MYAFCVMSIEIMKIDVHQLLSEKCVVYTTYTLILCFHIRFHFILPFHRLKPVHDKEKDRLLLLSIEMFVGMKSHYR